MRQLPDGGCETITRRVSPVGQVENLTTGRHDTNKRQVFNLTYKSDSSKR